MVDIDAISRGCAMGPPYDTIGCQEAKNLGINGEYCVCDTSLCNFDVTNESTSVSHQTILALHCFVIEKHNSTNDVYYTRRGKS